MNLLGRLVTEKPSANRSFHVSVFFLPAFLNILPPKLPVYPGNSKVPYRPAPSKQLAPKLNVPRASSSIGVRASNVTVTPPLDNDPTF